MKYIITSDFHLKYIENSDDRERRIKVESFLKSQIGKIDGLILAGDVFDLWVEWDKVIIKNYFSVLKIFATLKESGCRLIMLSGNHDFWFDDFLTKEIGFEIYYNNYTDDINGKKIYVSHGDLYTKNDFRYKVLRKILRLRITELFFKLLHPDIVLSLGKVLSRTAKNRMTNKKVSTDKERGLENKARELSKDYDIIIFGHTHNPLQIRINDSIYINCGDWIDNQTYCYFNDDTIELKTYKEDI